MPWAAEFGHLCPYIMYPPPEATTKLSEQPVERIEIVAGLYFRSVLLENGTVIPQHVHDHDHATFVGSGRARGWANGRWIGDKGPGEAFEVLAYQEHVFQALEANTRLCCVHDIESAESVKRKGI